MIKPVAIPSRSGGMDGAIPAPPKNKGGRPRLDFSREANGRRQRGGQLRAAKTKLREARALERAFQARDKARAARIAFYQHKITTADAKLAEMEDWAFFHSGLTDQRPGRPLWREPIIPSGSVNPADRMSLSPLGRFCLKVFVTERGTRGKWKAVAIYDAALAYADTLNNLVAAWGGPKSPGQRGYIPSGTGDGLSLATLKNWVAQLGTAEAAMRKAGGAAAVQAVQRLAGDDREVSPDQAEAARAGLKALWMAMGSVFAEQVRPPEGVETSKSSPVLSHRRNIDEQMECYQDEFEQAAEAERSEQADDEECRIYGDDPRIHADMTLDFLDRDPRIYADMTLDFLDRI